LLDSRVRVLGVEGDRAATAMRRGDAEDGGAKIRADLDHGPWGCQTCRASKTLILAVCLAREHEELDVAAGAVEPVEPRPPHPRVVHHEEIAATEQVRQLAKLAILESVAGQQVKQP
jgi:hypothetical protein